jgi:hypothetical protein
MTKLTRNAGRLRGAMTEPTRNAERLRGAP